MAWFIFLAAGCYCLFCLVLYVKQRSMLFYPVPEVRGTPAEALYIENGAERLKIWQLRGSSGRALIYFGGNAEDVSLNISFFRELLPEWSVFLCNYRGYGGSTGAPSEEALFSDALAVYDRVSQSHEIVGVMGRSLGTGVALYLGSSRDVERIALVTPYDSMVAVAASYYPIVPVSVLMKDRFESIEMAGDVKAPVLAIIAENDEVIPLKNSRRLVNVLDEKQTRTVVLEGVGHNTVDLSPEYRTLLQNFFRQDALRR